ncbi:MAG: SDR family NAD(P)-dependent oxidoreductase [Solimonas sp.]
MNPLYDTLFGLQGRRALVTGAARGLGREIARTLAGAGAQVAIADIDGEAAQATVLSLNAARPCAQAFTVDLCDEAQIASLFADVKARIGNVDVLVNCAGAYPKYDFLSVTRAQWDAVHQLNLRATFVCMQQAVAQMLEAGGGGRIINISSVASVHPATIGNAHYAAAKAGVNALTRGAALEFTGRGITVNAILPGPIASGDEGGTAQAPTDQPPVLGPAADRARWLAGRFGTPLEVAAAVLFLAGPGGAYTSGQTLAVDGGFLVS